jgi:hypothetical protein
MTKIETYIHRTGKPRPGAPSPDTIGFAVYEQRIIRYLNALTFGNAKYIGAEPSITQWQGLLLPSDISIGGRPVKPEPMQKRLIRAMRICRYQQCGKRQQKKELSIHIVNSPATLPLTYPIYRRSATWYFIVYLVDVSSDSPHGDLPPCSIITELFDGTRRLGTFQLHATHRIRAEIKHRNHVFILSYPNKALRRLRIHEGITQRIRPEQ